MRWLLTLVVLVVPPLAGAQEAPALATDKDKLSYAMGMDLGQQLKTQSVDIDPALFARGLADVRSGGKTLLTTEEAKAVISELQKAMIVKRAEAVRLSGEKNRTEGEAFLAANKAKEGVVTLPSGLQYRAVTTGSGPKPTLESTVVCQYRLSLAGGREIDSSYKRGQPFTIPVNKAIKGWIEVLPLMPVGSKWEVFVPPNLAYGERGAGADIGPNATLVFELELVGIR
jgi:FKBP-type peptidyl-prolyl cis-trans isomerase FklB